jgi:hypothetical protein
MLSTGIGSSQLQCWVAGYFLLASTMAVMPARTAGGNIDQPSKLLVCPIWLEALWWNP